MKKKILTMLFAGGLLLTACGDDTETVEGDTPVDDEAEETETTNDETTKEETEKASGTRSNPAGLGETIEWEVEFYDDMEKLDGLTNVTLNNIYEDDEAIDMLYFEEEALGDVEEGFTYAVADFTVELLEGDDDIPYTTRFRVGSVSEDGRKSPSGYTSLKDAYEENEYTDLYPGGTVDIKQAFLVPEDSEYLVEIEENISGSNFFEHN